MESKIPLLNSRCSHDRFTASLVPRSDGQLVLREFCSVCGISSSGSNLGYALPMVSDADVKVMSYKYSNRTLGEIMLTDPEYLRWLVVESKSSDRVRKSAARLLCGTPYVPPKDGDSYDAVRCYSPAFGWDCIRRILPTEPNP